MKIKTSVFVIVLSFFCHTLLVANTLIISDIDDTIKMSHVKALMSDAVFKAGEDIVAFRGMSEMLHLLDDAIADSHFVYLSNGNKTLMEKSHTQFIKRWQFPDGKILLKDGDDAHKENNIQRLIEAYQPDTVIFFGDNGERDIAVYAEAYQNWSQSVTFYTYIRIVYSNVEEEDILALENKQTGFVSPFEVLLDLSDKGVVTRDVAEKFGNQFGQDFAEELGFGNNSPLYFPYWQDCRDFKWTWRLPETEAWQAIYQRIARRCR